MTAARGLVYWAISTRHPLVLTVETANHVSVGEIGWYIIL